MLHLETQALANRRLPFFALVLGLALPSAAEAKPDRRGLQIEGLVGGSACIPGRVECDHNDSTFRGATDPSFGAGATIGFRPLRWLMIGALYRWGMFDTNYQVLSGDRPDYPWGGQHTAGILLRPILPLWRFDIGLNLAPSYSRQYFDLGAGRDHDYNQGFAFLAGPTFDLYVTDNVFVGGEVDFIINARRDTCEARGSSRSCFDVGLRPSLGPTHQVLFGFHIGAVLF